MRRSPKKGELRYEIVKNGEDRVIRQNIIHIIADRLIYDEREEHFGNEDRGLLQSIDGE